MITDRWISACWILGNDYKGSGYYGSYPPTYLKRIGTMYPDCKDILHLFSGSLPKSDSYTRFDIHEGADVVGDGNKLSIYFKPDTFDIIYADPPYSQEDAERYGSCLVNRNKVVEECRLVLKQEGHLVWMDQVLPMFSKEKWVWYGVINIIRSTNHRVRNVFLFQKR